jgi:lipopolysaccharide export LptBFGC system permease protein LptF
VVIVLYYPLLVLGVFLGERGIVPAISMALPNVALLALGIYLTRKVVLR